MSGADPLEVSNNDSTHGWYLGIPGAEQTVEQVPAGFDTNVSFPALRIEGSNTQQQMPMNKAGELVANNGIGKLCDHFG